MAAGALAPAASRPLLRRQPSDIRRDIQNVIVGELRNRALHQRRVRSVAIAFLEEIHLARQIDRMDARDARHVAEPFQSFTMADAALHRLASAAILDECFPFGEAAGGDIRDKSYFGIAQARARLIFGQRDDALADWFHAGGLRIDESHATLAD